MSRRQLHESVADLSQHNFITILSKLDNSSRDPAQETDKLSGYRTRTLLVFGVLKAKNYIYGLSNNHVYKVHFQNNP